MILVDTNILIDVLGADSIWRTWSSQQLNSAQGQGATINDIVYAELAGNFDSMLHLDAVLAAFALRHSPYSRHSLFLAGRAFRTYRQRGGPRSMILPDFLIGAHAVSEGWSVLTRDPKRYRQYFPGLTLISPA